MTSRSRNPNDPLSAALAEYDARFAARAALRARRGPLEKTIQARVVKWLERHGFFVWRNSTGTFRQGDRYVQCGIPGQADITGILPGGRRLEVEVKTATGRASKAQLRFREKIEAAGGLYVLARSVAALEAALCQYLTKSSL